MDTPFPRAAEGVVKNILRDCRVYAEETVKLTAERLQAVMVHAVRSVDAVVAAMGHTPPNTTHRAYDSILCKYMVALLKNEAPRGINSPEDTPLHPNDCAAEAKAEAKRQQGVEREVKRQREEEGLEEKRASAKRRRAEAQDAEVVMERKRAESVQRFLKERCTLEEYRTDVAAWKVRAFTPFNALWKAYQVWAEEQSGGGVAPTSNSFGRLLTPFVGGSKHHRLNMDFQPKYTWNLWNQKCLTDPAKRIRGRFGVRFQN